MPQRFLPVRGLFSLFRTPLRLKRRFGRWRDWVLPRGWTRAFWDDAESGETTICALSPRLGRGDIRVPVGGWEARRKQVVRGLEAESSTRQVATARVEVLGRNGTS